MPLRRPNYKRRRNAETNLMQELIKKLVVGSGVASALRSAVAIVGSFLVTNGATEIAGSGKAGIDSIGEIIAGLIAVAMYFAFKLIDGNKLGKLAGEVIGPKVPSVSHSLGRSVLTLINGALLGAQVPAMGETQEATQWLSLLILWAIDRFWSAKK